MVNKKLRRADREAMRDALADGMIEVHCPGHDFALHSTAARMNQSLIEQAARDICLNGFEKVLTYKGQISYEEDDFPFKARAEFGTRWSRTWRHLISATSRRALHGASLTAE